MTPEQRELLSEAPPPTQPEYAGAPDAWEAVEASLGSRLPADYKWLINTYGSGDFCDLLVVLSPFVASESSNLVEQVRPILGTYKSGGPDLCPFPCFPEPGGLLPFAGDTNGGNLFWLTRGEPDDWTLVIFDWRGGWDYQEYPLGLVRFLAEWISGRMPDCFFGVGNSPGIIRRDPVFCPAGENRPPLHESDREYVEVLKNLDAGVVRARDQAIAWLIARGHRAWEMDNFAAGALFACTSVTTDEKGMDRVHGGIVALYPTSDGWTVASLPVFDIGPRFEPLAFGSADEAAEAAADLIGENRSEKRGAEGKRDAADGS
jgi:hypothetical protein